MSSASQIDLATMPEDQLAEALSEVRSSRETKALRARLPEILAPFASNITVIEPIQTADTFHNDGANCCYCSVRERRIRLSVAVVLSRHSQSRRAKKKPRGKRLELFWRDWETSSRYLSGSADSDMHSITLQYGRSKATAFTGGYADPGTSGIEHSHGGIKSVVKKVVKGMGFHGSEHYNETEVIEALLSRDGGQLLDLHAQIDGRPTLRETIEDKLELELYY